jgi:hypothetical protein
LNPSKSDQLDLIVSNPPFFLTRSSKILFTDNPFRLDSFVESLARQAPAFLNDGGYFQMLCETVELEDQPWRERESRAGSLIRGATFWFSKTTKLNLRITPSPVRPKVPHSSARRGRMMLRNT